MKKLLSIVLSGLVIALIAGPAAVASAAQPGYDFPAHPPVWQASLDSKSGTDQDAPGFITTGACPTPARDIVGRIYGAGFPSSGVNVIANTPAGVSKMVPFTTGFQQSLRDTRVQQPQYTPYSGVYTIVVSCIVPAYTNKSFGNYVAKIRFTSPSHWVLMAPVTKAVGPIRLPNGTYVSINSRAAAQFKKQLRTDPKLAQRESLAVQSNGVVAPKTHVQTTPSAVHRSASTWPGIVLIVAGLLAAGGTLYFVRRKGQTA